MRLLRAAAALAVFAAAACGDSTGPSDVASIWTLRSVNGDPPPAVLVENEFYKLELLDAWYSFFEDGAYKLIVQLRENDGGAFQEVEKGIFFIDGSRITFQDDEGFALRTGTIDDNHLSFTERGVTLVFEKVEPPDRTV